MDDVKQILEEIRVNTRCASDTLEKLTPVFETLGNEIREGRKERKQFYSKKQLPLVTVVIWTIAMSIVMIISHAGNREIDIKGSALGAQGQITTGRNTNGENN